MVDNLAEKVDECPLNRGRLHTIGTTKSATPSSNVSAVQGLLEYEVNGRTVRTFRIVCTIKAKCCFRKLFGYYNCVTVLPVAIQTMWYL